MFRLTFQLSTLRSRRPQHLMIAKATENLCFTHSVITKVSTNVNHQSTQCYCYNFPKNAWTLAMTLTPTTGTSRSWSLGWTSWTQSLRTQGKNTSPWALPTSEWHAPPTAVSSGRWGWVIQGPGGLENMVMWSIEKVLGKGDPWLVVSGPIGT